ncbi:MAG: HAMP domain-containing sensor histidine kinase [Janthinobacterium lividum]
MKTWKYLWNHPLHRRVSLLTTVAVASAVVLSSLVGYLMMRATLVQASQAIALSIASDLAVPAARDIRTAGALPADLRQAGNVVVEAVGTDGQPYAVVVVPLPGTGHALLVGRSLAPVVAVLDVQRLVLPGTSAAGVLAAAVAGVVVGRAALRPVRQLTEAVEHVTETQDLQPVSVPYARGDLAILAASFNRMLASLTKARDRTARLVADAGHELRTPLTSLRTDVDLLASDLHRDHLSLDAKATVLGDLQGQLGELNDMIGDLVHVARVDTALLLAPVDVRDVVGSALERVRRRAQGATFDVELDPLFVVADAEALGRAVTNLLDNAVKWSPPGGTVRVRLEGNRLRVSDAGPGIPEADLPYVFDRFFRGESARRTKGTGLGLAIVAKTVEELGGSVAAGRSTEGGAELTLQLPGVTSREAVSSLLVPSA